MVRKITDALLSHKLCVCFTFSIEIVAVVCFKCFLINVLPLPPVQKQPFSSIRLGILLTEGNFSSLFTKICKFLFKKTLHIRPIRVHYFHFRMV